MNDRKWFSLCDERPVAKAPAVAENHNVAGQRILDLNKSASNKSEIALVAAVKMPIRRIRPWIDRGKHSAIDKSADQKHSAIYTRPLYIGTIVIGRSDPSSRLSDDKSPLFHIKHPCQIA